MYSYIMFALSDGDFIIHHPDLYVHTSYWSLTNITCFVDMFGKSHHLNKTIHNIENSFESNEWEWNMIFVEGNT